ncbi:MAG: glycosyltransferase family 39 protein [Planctomycetes bacterium]|nr:glycosyltransferase family 39 protein [Planctomycetota bacterium]
MTLSWLGIVHVVLAPLAFGCVIARWAAPRGDRLFVLAFAQLAGTLALALLEFAWLAARLDVAAFRFVPLPVAAIAWFATRRAIARSGDEAPLDPSSHGPGASRAARVTLAIAVTLACVFVAHFALAGSETLVMIGDEANIWAGKAKAIWVENGFNAGLGERLRSDFTLQHQDYPLLNPLLQVFTFANAGGIVHVGNRIPIFACVVALVLLVASSVRRAAGSWAAAIAVLLVAGCHGIVEECENAAADGLVALGLLAVLECAARARSDVRWWRGVGIALAFLAWSKNEGTMLAVCAVVALGLDAATRGPLRGALRVAATAIPAAALVLLQWGFNFAAGVRNDLIGNPDAPPFLERVVAQAWDHAPKVARAAYERGVLDPLQTNWIVLAFVVLALFLPRIAWRHARTATIALALGMLGFVVVYLGTSRDIDWHLRWSIDRILFQLTPACALAAATIARGAFDGKPRP